MNEIVNKFLLVGDKVMSEMHLRQLGAFSKPEFTCSGCGPFTKDNVKIKKKKRFKVYSSKQTK